MIERLLVKNSPAFDEINIYPSAGFNVFSGVSGSGKSVLMGSILALFGIKDSNASLIESDIVSENIHLEHYGILDSDNIVISVVKKDKVKYFINNQSSSKKRVKEIFGEQVKYIHSHSTSELKAENLLYILDSIIIQKQPKFRELLESYHKHYNDFLIKKSELETLENDEKNILELKEFARYEIAQIEEIAPKIGEYDELLTFKKDLSRKEKIMEKINVLNPVIEHFSSLIGFLDSIDKNKAVFEESLNEISEIINDEEERLANISEDDIESVLDRLEKLGRLIYKYGSIESTLEHLEKKKRDLEYYENISFNKNSLQKEIATLHTTANGLAGEISMYRLNNLNIFTEMLESKCKMLLLPSPKISLNTVDLGINGIDLLEIALQDSSIETISSGEFNRLKLAILCIDMEYNKKSGILILDEIDANLSGSESEGVAKVLSFLAKDYQIFAISHQSHMPSFADNHYLVYKNTQQHQKSNIILLDDEGRVREIARMISGQNITNEALLFAKERVESLKNHKNG